MTIQNGARSQIAIPAQGLIEFKDQLSDMLERYGSVTEESNQPELPEGKSLRADNKTFFFDCGSNARGTFLRITESRQRYRQTIMIPEKFLQQFRTQLTEMIDQIAAQAQNGEAEAKPAVAGSEKSAAGSASVKTEADKTATVD
jgi:transcriptional activator protein Pur-alpha